MDILPGCKRHDDGTVIFLTAIFYHETDPEQSIAHGSNDVANAVGPWSAAYSTWKSGVTDTQSKSPIWILVVAGFLLGAGFWVRILPFPN